MRKFAKIFETERGQIVVMRLTSDDDKPEVRFFFDPNHEDLAVCSFALNFPDSDAGDEAADKTFDLTDQTGVERVVFPMIDQARKLADQEVSQ